MVQGFLGRLFRTTSVDAMRARAGKSKLKRALRGRDLIAVGLGTMIGGGIFATIGPGVHKAGPAVIIAFLLAGFASLLAALCYAELGAVIPSAGSAYTFAYATLGQLVGWIVGWNLILEYAISAAPVAQQFSASLQEALYAMTGWKVPPVFASANLAHTGDSIFNFHVDWSHTTADLIGAVFILILTALIVVGIRETARANNALVVIKVGALLVFIVAGATLFHPHNLTPFNPVGWIGPLDPQGIPTGIFGGAALVFFTYIGFDAATTTSEECVNPSRDIPVGVMGSLLIGTALYCAVAIVLVGAVPWQNVNINTPLQSALAQLHVGWAEWVVRIGVLAGTSSVALVSLLGQSRIFFAMSRDRLLPPAVATVNARTKTPVRMSIITGIIVALFTLIVPLDILLQLVNIGTMSAFIAVSIGVLILRVTRPELPRPFRTPFVWVTAIVGILVTSTLAVLGLSKATWEWFGWWLLVGLVVYLSYGFRQPMPDSSISSDEPPPAISV
jgi:APA family basic amino acid/polyamine antiporter